ncbi:amidohydrolase family protein [Pararobbsia silviterrae]|uniref:Amidohydrolase n=1 Tax=Pararobbsia silviterrae TaxID=1792498 RepID=A0A494XKB9_9BURK|nr:amidohydrolase [Pararobbsia silviterrae]RKP50182.1 amidohydrolase [Pararobbsia silviterrae]
MHIIDTHLHLMYPDSLTYGWTDAVPMLQGTASIEMYEARVRTHGVARALMMEVDVDTTDIEAEIDLVGAIVARGDTIVEGMIAACRPEQSADLFAASLDRLSARPHVRGVRRILHTSPDALSTSDTFAANLNRLARRGYTFDLCVLASQLASVALPLADRCPDLTIILDHCGNPDIAREALDPWRADIRALAERPNVHCKVSGIVNHAAPGWAPDDLRPYFEHLVACFGWDRLVWGSDWPVCRLGGDVNAWLDATRALIADCSTDEQASLLSRNAVRLYRMHPVQNPVRTG